MQFTQLLLTTGLLASSAVVAAPVAGKSMMAASTEWTIQSMQRVCNTDDTSCTWTFGIYPGSGNATACSFDVNTATASQANGGPANCGDYTVTSGWSGQFGDGNGFTTLSVVNNPLRQIIYPSYTDAQLDTGEVVEPDQSYTPTTLP